MFKKVCPTKVLKVIESLKGKKSYGHDNLSGAFLKKIKLSITEPLTLIINKILMQGQFPDTWKVAKVVPLFKKGEKNLPTNYRPISLLPVLSKIAEKVIAEQMYGYFEKNGLFPKKQYGFRRHKSTEQALNNLVYEANNSLSKEQHNIKYYQNELSINLIKSYLSGRASKVFVNNLLSSTVKLPNIGCPQGSCLGPLLYLIYTAEFDQLLNTEIGIMFADDTSFILARRI